MKSVVLYAAKTKLSDLHNPVSTIDGDIFWIRVQQFKKTNQNTALDLASPMEGELVLNSMELGKKKNK